MNTARIERILESNLNGGRGPWESTLTIANKQITTRTDEKRRITLKKKLVSGRRLRILDDDVSVESFEMDAPVTNIRQVVNGLDFPVYMKGPDGMAMEIPPSRKRQHRDGVLSIFTYVAWDKAITKMDAPIGPESTSINRDLAGMLDSYNPGLDGVLSKAASGGLKLGSPKAPERYVNYENYDTRMICHEMDYSDIREIKDYIILEDLGLMLFTDRQKAFLTKHYAMPIFESASWLQNTTGIEIYIEAHPGSIGEAYTNLGGHAIPVRVRENDAVQYDRVCFRFRNTLIAEMHFGEEQELEEFPLEDALVGPGYKGIRIYRSRIDAREDARRPMSDTQVKIHEDKIEKLKRKIGQLEGHHDEKKETLQHKMQLLKDDYDRKHSTLKAEYDKALHEEKQRRAKERTSWFTGVVDAVVGAVKGFLKLFTIF